MLCFHPRLSVCLLTGFSKTSDQILMKFFYEMVGYNPLLIDSISNDLDQRSSTGGQKVKNHFFANNLVQSYGRKSPQKLNI